MIVVQDSPTSSMSDEDWETMELRAVSAIKLNLAKNVFANVHKISTAKELLGET